MSLVTINGVNVIGGSIMMPLVGVWTADLVIDAVEGFAAGTHVTIESGSFSLSGTVAPDRTGDFLDAVHVRVLGGAGGMATLAMPKSYTQPGAFVRDVLNGLCRDAGETLSSTASASFTGTNLTAWAVVEMPVSQALQCLIDFVAPGLNWRILANGELWVGSETWPNSSASFELLEQDPTQGQYDLGVESPSITPGVSLEGVGNVDRVEHHIGENTIRSHVWTVGADPDRGFKSAVQALAIQALPGIDYLTFYDARVVSQSADGATLDLQPLDPRLPGFGSVPLKLGIPATVAKFATGKIVRLGWDRGNPARPYACLFDGGETLTSLELGGDDNVLTRSDFATFLYAWQNAAVGTNDGGALMRANTLALLATAPGWTPGSFVEHCGSNIIKAGRD
jgi:hypothetical protein